jgi:hypothetical protein
VLGRGPGKEKTREWGKSMRRKENERLKRAGRQGERETAGHLITLKMRSPDDA